MSSPVKYLDSTRYRTCQLKAASVGIADTNVPVYVSIPTTIRDAAYRSDGKDIVVTLADGTLLPRILVNFGKSRATNWLVYRDLAVDTVTGGTEVYIQYGGASVNVANDSRTFDNCMGGNKDHYIVCPFQDEATNYGTLVGNAITDETGYTSGPLGRSIFLSEEQGSSQFLDNAALEGGDGSTDNRFTLLIVHKDTGGNVGLALSKGIAYNLVITNTDSKLRLRCQDESVVNYKGVIATSIDDSDWSYLSVIKPLNPTFTTLMKNGVDVTFGSSESGGSYVAMESNNSNLTFGGGFDESYGSYWLGGFWFINGVLSQAQVQTWYNNISTFSTNGSLDIGDESTDFDSGDNQDIHISTEDKNIIKVNINGNQIYDIYIDINNNLLVSNENFSTSAGQTAVLLATSATIV
jgi:hypothetical protein